jgi:transposase InsO family protein
VSKARLVITAVVVEGRRSAEVAQTYGVSRSWVYELVARYRTEGDVAFEPRSRRPRRSPRTADPATVALIVGLRTELVTDGLDAGCDTIVWHLEHHHGIRISRATVHRHLTNAGLIAPAPKKRPRSSYIRFQAEQPNECWQADFTHYRLVDSDDVEILCWLDDHSRFALSITAHTRVTGPIVLATFRACIDRHGPPQSTLTDNGMVFTARFAGGRGGRNAFESELTRRRITQKNSRPNHPTTCGKVERLHQTLKQWLRAQPQPATITELQALLDAFTDRYNRHRPHKSLPHRATPATIYTTRPKATPTDHARDTHYRVRHDRVDDAGSITLRVNGRLHHIGIGRTHARTHVVVLIDDLHARVVHAATGELLRELTIDRTRDYQPTGAPKGPTRPKNKRSEPQ